MLATWIALLRSDTSALVLRLSAGRALVLQQTGPLPARTGGGGNQWWWIWIALAAIVLLFFWGLGGGWRRRPDRR